MELIKSVFHKIVLFSFLVSTNVFAVSLDLPKNVKSNKNMTNEIDKDYVLIYFWATWCPDCKEKLKTDLNKYENAKVNFKTIAVEKDLEKVNKFILSQKIEYPVYMDETKKFQKELGVFSVPTIVLLHKNNGQFEKVAIISGKDWSEIDRILEEKK